MLRSKHCGLPGLPDHVQTSQKAGFSHAHNNFKVEVHGWLLSGSEELFAALFFTLVTNK